MQKFVISLVLALLVLLVSCTKDEDNTRGETMPLLNITDRGLSQGEAVNLLVALNISKERVLAENGVALYADEERFGNLPVKDLERGKGNEDEGKVLLQELLLDKMKEFRVPDGEESLAKLKEALNDSELSPERRFLKDSAFKTNFIAKHSTFSAFGIKGESLVSEVNVDTRVLMDLSFDGSKIVGPGAKLSATFDNEGLTQLRYAMRGLEKGKEVRIFSQAEADRLCQERFKNSFNSQNLQAVNLETLAVNAELMYYAPSHSFTEATTLVPHYHCLGTVQVGNELVSLLEQPIPATEDESVVPSVELSASARGSRVSAELKIQGGQAPYTIQWSSKSTTDPDLSEFANKTEVAYDVLDRDSKSLNVNETLIATVIDANGIQVNASETISDVEAKAGAKNLEVLVGGIRDYGIEIPAMEFGNLAQGFANEMSGSGVTRRFFWTGNSAWEQDFKSPNDSAWIDNTDITLYTGHGWSGGFTFNGNHQDTAIDTNDATGDWGDKDLEWLALYSCQVLKLDSTTSVVGRWGQEFDGLHILLGFHTNAAANMGFTGEFAHNMLRNPFLWWNNPMKVRVAWFDATDSHQPNGRVAVAMGPIRSGNVSNFNDYFHGKGPVGPDIPSGSIVGWWVYSFTS